MTTETVRPINIIHGEDFSTPEGAELMWVQIENMISATHRLDELLSALLGPTGLPADHLHNGVVGDGGILPDYARLADDETITGEYSHDNLLNILDGWDIQFKGNGSIAFQAGTGNEFFLGSTASTKELFLDAGVNFYVETLKHSVGAADITLTGPTINIDSLTLSSSDASITPRLKIDQLGAGDSGLEFAVAAQSWSIGIDNLATDVFVIAAGSGLTFPAIMIRVAGSLVGIGTTPSVPPGFLLHVYNNSGSTTAMQSLEQDSTGDATFHWLLRGGQGYAGGIDNSVAGDPYKFVANPGALGKLEVGTDVYTITSAPDWTFNVEAKFEKGVQFATSTVAASPTLDRDDHVLLVDSDAANRTITLPSTHTGGDTYKIKNIGASANTVTVARNGNNIEGAAADFTLNDLEAAEFVSDGTDWWVF